MNAQTEQRPAQSENHSLQHRQHTEEHQGRQHNEDTLHNQNRSERTNEPGSSHGNRKQSNPGHTGQNSRTGAFGIDQNIGKVDRYIRLSAGLFLIGSAISGRHSNTTSKTLLTIGAMSATEGILGWCPMMHLFGIRDTNGALGAQSQQSGVQSKRAQRQSKSFGMESQSSNPQHSESGSDRHNWNHDDGRRPSFDGGHRNHKEMPPGAADGKRTPDHQVAMDTSYEQTDGDDQDDVLLAMNTSFQ